MSWCTLSLAPRIGGKEGDREEEREEREGRGGGVRRGGREGVTERRWKKYGWYSVRDVCSVIQLAIFYSIQSLESVQYSTVQYSIQNSTVQHMYIVPCTTLRGTRSSYTDSNTILKSIRVQLTLRKITVTI